MDRGIEFIKIFVRSNKQERLIYELQNPKKRKDLFWRFAGSDIFKTEYLQEVEYMPGDDLADMLFQLGKSKEVFFIGSSFIGEISLKEAVEKASSGEICIIYCGSGKGYHQGEEERSKTERYFLIQQ